MQSLNDTEERVQEEVQYLPVFRCGWGAGHTKIKIYGGCQVLKDCVSSGLLTDLSIGAYSAKYKFGKF